MTPGPGIEPGTHWWEARALITAPPLILKEYMSPTLCSGEGITLKMTASKSRCGVLLCLYQLQWQFSLRNEPVGSHGRCIHQNKYKVQGDEYNYRDSLQACLVEEMGHKVPHCK